MVQETRIKETGSHEFTSSDVKSLRLYYSGKGVKSIWWVDIGTTEGANVAFLPYIRTSMYYNKKN